MENTLRVEQTREDASEEELGTDNVIDLRRERCSDSSKDEEECNAETRDDNLSPEEQKRTVVIKDGKDIRREAEQGLGTMVMR